MPEFERRIAAFSSEIATKRQSEKEPSTSAMLPNVSALHINAPRFRPGEEEALEQFAHLN
jgi:hypothetical protein